jgi:type I restriction enzyme S subunit
LTGGNTKIQRKDYLPEGLLPVIDQGQDEVAGYTNEIDAAYTGRLPVVLFGDHTRAFKYVDQPFALGADGVKVLSPKEGFETKFLYYYFLACDVPSRGYSRHFKYLKALSVPVFAPSEQHHIVELLDEADRLRKLRREADAKAARILPVLFLKMFGDPTTNPIGWQVKDFAGAFNDQTAGQVKVQTRTFLPSGALPVIDQGQEQIAGYVDDTSIAYSGSLPAIVFGDHTRIFKYVDHPFALGADGVRVLTAKDGFEPLFAYWQCRMLDMPSAGYSRHFKFLKEKKFIKPDSKYQLAFAQAAAVVERSLEGAAQASCSIDALFSTLMQRAFSGHLTAEWREAHMKELLVEMEEQARLLDLPPPEAFSEVRRWPRNP